MELTQFAYPLTALVTLLATFIVFVFSFRVGMMRGKLNVPAPGLDGPEEFQRANRIHLNSLELIVTFLPVLWLFAALVNDLYAGVAGAVWIIGRILYSKGYMADPAKRSMGFMISFVPFIVMLVWSFIEVIKIAM